MNFEKRNDNDYASQYGVNNSQNEYGKYDGGNMSSVSSTDVNSFMTRTYGWMGFALLLSALSAWYVGNNESVMTTFASPPIMLILVQLGLVFGLTWGINRMSANMASLLFVIYSLVTGVTIGFCFMYYTKASILSTFLTCALLFGVMSVYGMVTKKDLTSWGKFLFFAVIGLIIAGVVNLFLGSSMLSLIASCVGVVVFLGLTAYDTQKIKMRAYQADGSEMFAKLSIVGALELYLDFINLFLYLLRFTGTRRD